MATTPKEEFWTCKDGRRLAVGEMDVDHLRNVLRMVLRNRRRLREERARQEKTKKIMLDLARRFNQGEDIDFTLDLDGDWDFIQPVSPGSSP